MPIVSKTPADCILAQLLMSRDLVLLHPKAHSTSALRECSVVPIVSKTPADCILVQLLMSRDLMLLHQKAHSMLDQCGCSDVIVISDVSLWDAEMWPVPAKCPFCSVNVD